VVSVSSVERGLQPNQLTLSVTTRVTQGFHERGEEVGDRSGSIDQYVADHEDLSSDRRVSVERFGLMPIVTYPSSEILDGSDKSLSMG
jgi:hypothetical protein